MGERLPMLKDFAWLRSDTALTLTRDAGIDIVLEPAEPELLDLLRLLDGTRTIEEIVGELNDRGRAVAHDDVRTMLDHLDEVSALEDAAATTSLTDAERQRYASNLEFFGSFASLERTRFDYQERLRGSAVLLLGAGGIGSAVLAALAGLGVGSVVLVDGDRVELGNLGRQFLYAESDVGRGKAVRAAARARELNSTVSVNVRERYIGSPRDVIDLLGGIDLVVSTIDEPEAASLWVNQACVAAGVPFVAGGVWARRAQYLSVRPGLTGCLNCLELFDATGPEQLIKPATPVNRAIGPTAYLLGGLMAAEALRYLTAYCAPIAAGRVWIVDAADGRVEAAGGWPASQACEVCHPAATPRSAP